MISTGLPRWPDRDAAGPGAPHHRLRNAIPMTSRDRLLLCLAKLVAQTVPRSDRLVINADVKAVLADIAAENTREKAEAAENAR